MFDRRLMKHNEGHFQGIKSTKIFYQNWLPDGDTRGVLLVSHGFAEHSGRYENVVNAVVPENYAVWALDHRGHGQSEGKSNHVGRFTDFVEDIGIFETIIKEKHPDTPLFLLGHSMGSFIASHYMATRANQSDYKALIISGTGGATGPGFGTNAIKNFFGKTFSVFLPKLSAPSGLDPEFISHDKEAVTAYINDPHVHYKKITVRLGAEFLKMINGMLKIAPKITIPTLIQVGSEDDTFKDQDKLLKAIGSNKKEYKTYEGFRHEVYNELEKEIPLNDLKNWILMHTT